MSNENPKRDGDGDKERAKSKAKFFLENGKKIIHRFLNDSMNERPKMRKIRQLE
jgi:hypothetical protein